MGERRDYGPVVDVGGHQIRARADGDSLTWTVEDAPGILTRDPLRDIVGTPIEIGHITRLENLPGRITNTLANHRIQAQDLKQRITQAEAGLGKPFQYSADLADAEDRYSQITATMAADQNEPVLVPAETSAGPTPGAHAVRVNGLLAETRAKLADPARPAFTNSQRRPERNPQPNPDRGIDRE